MINLGLELEGGRAGGKDGEGRDAAKGVPKKYSQLKSERLATEGI